MQRLEKRGDCRKPITLDLLSNIVQILPHIAFSINAIQGGIEQFLLYPNAKVFQAIKLSIMKCFNYYYNTQV